MDELHAKVRDNIKRTGRHIMYVFPNEDDPDKMNGYFGYSIGNTNKGLPELLLVGNIEPRYMMALINTLSQKMLDRGRKFDDGELVDLGGKIPMCIVDASDEVKDRFTIQCENFLDAGRDYAVQQIVMPDKTGKLPWQEGCADPYAKVKVYRRMLS
jgi:hypothetical protein